MPTQLLTLLLTMSMGVLGSVMHITWEFLAVHNRRPVRWFLLHPFIGAISAIVVFVVIKAGQFGVISSDELDAVNPFFLSFVGIVSGLLSDRAYSRVQRVGIAFLGSDEQDYRRWGMGLKAAMTEAGISPEDLSRFVDADPDLVGRWIEQSDPVPLNEQRILASYFRRPIRDLFTDLPPVDGDGELPVEELVEVPDLLNSTESHAEKMVLEAGLTIGSVTLEASEGMEEGLVLDQAPDAGSQVARGTAINLRVTSRMDQETFDQN